MSHFLQVVDRLRSFYGQQLNPVPTNPFEHVLWSNVAYLADDDRRARAFAVLRDRVGLDPRSVLHASQADLLEAAGHGIMAEAVASRIRQAAAVAIELGDLGTAIRRPVPEARRALRRFPGIGGPGADMVLLFSRAHAIPAVDSNGLRVLQRLGLAGSIESYSAAYRAATLVMASEIGTDSNRLIEAYLLLRVHGRELCRRSSPDCTACPVRALCAYGSRRG